MTIHVLSLTYNYRKLPRNLSRIRITRINQCWDLEENNKNPFVKVTTSSMMSCLCPFLASQLADKVLSLTISSLPGCQPSQRKNSENREQSQTGLNYAEVHPVLQELKNTAIAKKWTVYSQLGSHIIFLFFPVFRLFPCKGGGMMGWFCLDARIQAKSFYHNTNDDSRNRKNGVFMVFFLTQKFTGEPYFLSTFCVETSHLTT